MWLFGAAGSAQLVVAALLVIVSVVQYSLPREELDALLSRCCASSCLARGGQPSDWGLGWGTPPLPAVDAGKQPGGPTERTKLVGEARLK